MQFNVKKTDFLKGLQTVQNAIAQKNTLPILSNLLIEVDNNEAKITATDLDIGISSKVAVTTKETGSITVPAKKLVDIIKELPDENEVSITLKKNNMITIDCKNVQCKIIGLPKDEFPQMPDFKEKDAILLPQKLLKEMLAQTNFAASKDETRYVLNGVLFMIKKDKMQIVATDGRRLALSSRVLPEEIGAEKKAIVPTRTVQELLKILGDDKNVKVIMTDNQIFFDIDKTNIISRLIDGDFPNFDDVIPKEKKDKAKIERTGLLAATKRASLFTNPDSMAVKMDFAKNKLIISKNSPFLGEVREELTVSYGGKTLTIGFNPSYIIDLLNNIKENEIEIELEDIDKPAVIRKNTEYVYVVLPMQLS